MAKRLHTVAATRYTATVAGQDHHSLLSRETVCVLWALLEGIEGMLSYFIGE